MHFSEKVKLIGDIAAGAATLATLIAWLPPMAAAASLVYALIRIWETETVKKWTGRD